MQEAILVPAILGLVQAAKTAGLNSRYAPLLAVLLGLVSSFIFSTNWLEGITAGLAAAGLWSGVKATASQ